MKRGQSPRCAVAITAEMVGGRWKSVILFYLLDRGPMRFGELRDTLVDITERMLTLQLRELEALGLVNRTVYPVVPPHVEYSLTEFGHTLERVIRSMAEWGKQYRRRCDSALKRVS